VGRGAARVSTARVRAKIWRAKGISPSRMMACHSGSTFIQPTLYAMRLSGAVSPKERRRIEP